MNRKASPAPTSADIDEMTELLNADAGDALRRIDELERRLPEIEAPRRPAAELRLRVARMSALFYQGSTDAVFSEADRAFDCLRRIPEVDIASTLESRFRLHLTVGVGALYAGLYDHSVNELGRAAELAAESDDNRAHALALGNGIYALVLARRPEAALAATRAADVLIPIERREIDLDHSGVLFLTVASALARVIADPTCAASELAGLCDWDRALSSSDLHGRSAAFYCVRALINSQAQRPAAAEADFRTSVARADRGGHSLWAAKARIGLARVTLDAGDLTGARQLLEEVVALSPVSNVVHGDALELLSELLQRAGDTEGALRRARDALAARNRIALYQIDRRISRVEAERRLAAAERETAEALRSAQSERSDREIAEAVSARLEHEVTSRTQELREALARLDHQATHDALTGLANRRMAQRHLTALLEDGASCGILYCDIDRFKLVNDLNGHEAGDWVLIEMAARLRHVTASGDLLARFGGDEFVLVCRDVPSMEDLLARGRAVVATAERPLPRGAPTQVVTISVGATIARPGATATSLLREADTALYRAKARGGARVAPYDEILRRDVARRVEIEQILHLAIQQESLGLTVQPIVDLEDPVSGTQIVEAFVKVTHPWRGVMPAGDFLDVAEETGLLGRIDGWLLEAACRWAAPQPAQRVSLNVRWRDLSDPGYFERVGAVLAATSMDASRVILEISERGLTAPPHVVAPHIARLKRLGVLVALDDFGTAHSSLAALRHLPLDFVKLDGAFVTAAPSSPADASIMEMVAALGRQLGITVIAEGLESQRQVDVARDCGCAYGQGYHLGRPYPLDLPRRPARAVADRGFP